MDAAVDRMILEGAYEVGELQGPVGRARSPHRLAHAILLEADFLEQECLDKDCQAPRQPPEFVGRSFPSAAPNGCGPGHDRVRGTNAGTRSAAARCRTTSASRMRMASRGVTEPPRTRSEFESQGRPSGTIAIVPAMPAS